MNPQEPISDHDLLIELKIATGLNFGYLRDDIKSLTEGTHDQLKDHEHRLRQLENDYVPNAVYSPAHQSLIESIDSIKRIVYMAMGGWALFTFLAVLALRFWGKN